MSILNSSYKDKSLTSIQLYLQLNSKNYSRKTKMATFHPSCRTRIVHIRCYRYFSTVASRSMAINCISWRGKRKRPPLFNTPLRREKIDRSEEPVCLLVLLESSSWQRAHMPVPVVLRIHLAPETGY